MPDGCVDGNPGSSVLRSEDIWGDDAVIIKHLLHFILAHFHRLGTLVS